MPAEHRRDGNSNTSETGVKATGLRSPHSELSTVDAPEEASLTDLDRRAAEFGSWQLQPADRLTVDPHRSLFDQPASFSSTLHNSGLSKEVRDRYRIRLR